MRSTGIDNGDDIMAVKGAPEMTLPANLGAELVSGRGLSIQHRHRHL